MAFAATLREVLPRTMLVVDHWHLHRLGKLMLTQTRQRVTSRFTATAAGPAATAGPYRRLLLRGERHLSAQQ